MKACSCCTGIEVLTPTAESNRPGLPAIAYRAGTQASFFTSMVARLSSLALDIPLQDGSGDTQRIYPLRALTTRATSDPAIALLDAWATVADVLTFYQERIANEGYLRTATEHRSILELGKLVGYRLRPAISAGVYLAFTVMDGFNGIIPAGSRAQSVPLAGQQPQFFETSIDLPARDVWNALVPRSTRPQLITFTADPTGNGTEGTDAKTRDTIYFSGLTTQLNPGDTVLIVASDDPRQAQLRRISAVDAQSDSNRTEVTLDEPPLVLDTLPPGKAAAAAFQPYIDEAASIFVDISLATQTAGLLSTLIADIALDNSYDTAVLLAQAARPQVEGWYELSSKRHFTRLEPWLGDLLRAFTSFIRQMQNPVYGKASKRGPAPAGRAPRETSGPYDPPVHLAPVESRGPGSPLTTLTGLIQPLALPPSIQPANSLRLPRSVQTAFTRQSDLAPRLLTSLRPRLAPSLYTAWSGAQAASATVEVNAVRVRAGLFAGTSNGLPTYDGNKTLTGFTGVSISPAWGALSSGGGWLETIALDAAYDKIAVGSWIAIVRPDLNALVVLAGTTTTTYHQVTAVRTVTMAALATPPSAGGAGAPKDPTLTAVPYGFSAKSTQLTLEPPWLQDIVQAGQTPGITDYLGSGDFLRGAVVHAQGEPLDLAEEPLDNDIEGGTIELATLYDGLDTGRWIVVSGDRTDIPNTTGVTAGELVMIASVTQGARALLSVDFPPGLMPFSSIAYVTDANANGDQLVVGTPSGSLATLPLPTVTNQQYSDEVELAPGFYASAYVPSSAERSGDFGPFTGLLVDPSNNQPYTDGVIPASALATVFAWRITTKPVHTILTLAKPLAYTYDPATVTIQANVVLATNGQSTGEVLGSGDATQSLQSFALHQAPLTYLAAPTPFGAQSTLTVLVNEIAWTEADNLVALGPRDRDYVTSQDDSGNTSVTFGTGQNGARVPSGNGNVKATYRYGSGSSGNVLAQQISQLATQPLGVKSVINPLAASGGADGDSIGQARSNIPIAVLALDRLVSVQDYADFARAFAGIAKAGSARISDGQRLMLHLTVAGNGDIAIDPGASLARNLVQALVQYGDPGEPLQLAARGSKLLVISAGVCLQSGYQWETVAPAIRTALLAFYSFDARDLGQSAYLSEAIGIIQAVDGVLYSNVSTFDSVADTVTASQLAALGSTLGLNDVVTAAPARVDPTQTDPALRILPAQLVTLTPAIADTLILTEISA